MLKHPCGNCLTEGNANSVMLNISIALQAVILWAIGRKSWIRIPLVEEIAT